MLNEEQMLEVFKALSDPNRMRLYTLLMASDHTNSELMNETKLSQNLLSHHLTVLTDAGLVRMHQSIGDARRHYYSADMDMPFQLQEWWGQYCPPEPGVYPALDPRPTLLFLCRSNSTRSLLSEAVARRMASATFEVQSAGVESIGEFSAVARKVLTDRGVDIDTLKPKTFDELGRTAFDYVVTVCDIVHESPLPDNLMSKHIIHWSLREPLKETFDFERQVAIAHELFDEIERRLAFLAHQIGVQKA